MGIQEWTILTQETLGTRHRMDNPDTRNVRDKTQNGQSWHNKRYR